MASQKLRQVESRMSLRSPTSVYELKGEGGQNIYVELAGKRNQIFLRGNQRFPLNIPLPRIRKKIEYGKEDRRKSGDASA